QIALVVGQFVHSVLPPAPIVAGQKITRRLAGLSPMMAVLIVLRGAGPHRLLNGMPGHVAEPLNFVDPDGSATGSGAGLQILNVFLSMQAQLFVPLGICVTGMSSGCRRARGSLL